MRSIFLALALVFAIGNADRDATDDAIQALVDEGQDTKAKALAEEAAAQGDPRAHEWLGWFYDEARGVERDLDKAVYHYEIAIEAGQNYARWRMGVMIDEGEVPGSLSHAVKLFELAAAEDFTNAMTSLAVMQATGRGTAVDYEAALANYMRAARAGNMHGVQGVGVLFLLGQGVEEDAQEAAAWFLVATAGGNEVGQNNFAIATKDLSEGDIRTIIARAEDIASELGTEFEIEFESEAEVSS